MTVIIIKEKISSGNICELPFHFRLLHNLYLLYMHHTSHHLIIVVGLLFVVDIVQNSHEKGAFL
jgi:hypothetical protein